MEYPDSTEAELNEKMDKLKSHDIIKEDSVDLNVALQVEDNDEPSYKSVPRSFAPNDPWDGYVGWDEAHPDGAEWGYEAVNAIYARS